MNCVPTLFDCGTGLLHHDRSTEGCVWLVKPAIQLMNVLSRKLRLCGAQAQVILLNKVIWRISIVALSACRIAMCSSAAARIGSL